MDRKDMATRTRVFAAVLAWCAIAGAVGYSGVLLSLPRPVLQVILFTLTAACLTGYFAVSRVRGDIDALGTRALIAIHLSRFVGAYFLILHEQGRLPTAFAVYGGWGDIITASGALALLTLPMRGTRVRLLVGVWNLYGFVEICFVVATAGICGMRDPDSMFELAKLPLSLLPTFLVPLIIASHVVIFVHLRAAAMGARSR